MSGEFKVGQNVFSAYSKHGGSPVGTPLVVTEVQVGTSVVIGKGLKKERIRLADRILCDDSRWYYPDYLSAENPL